MKKLLLASLLCATALAGCSASNEQAVTSANGLEDDLKKQLAAYETTIYDQQQKIISLEAEIAELKTNPIALDDFIFVFRGDETASYVLPTIIPFGEDENLVEAIHSFVTDGYDIGLNHFYFEDDEQLLVLDYDDNAERVQGSAGTYIFLQSMTESYFANFPKLRAIKLLKNGDGTEEVIGESGENSLFIREPFYYEPNTEF